MYKQRVPANREDPSNYYRCSASARSQEPSIRWTCQVLSYSLLEIRAQLPNSSSSAVIQEGSEDVKAICIIGAGPAGLAALKTILDTHQFKANSWKPTLYESRDRVGGVWCVDSPLLRLLLTLRTGYQHHQQTTHHSLLSMIPSQLIYLTQ